MQRNIIRERRFLYVTPEDFEEAEKNGIPEKLVKARVYRDGWEINRAITKKPTSKVFEPWERWKDKAVVSKMTFYQRMKSKGKRIKWTEETAAMTPKGSFPGGHENVILLTPEQKNIMQENGVTRRVLRHRVKNMGMSIEEAISRKPMTKREAGLIRQGKKVY